MLMISFTMKKLLSVVWSICLFFLLFPFPEETDPKKILLRVISKSIAYAFLWSLISFQVLHLGL